MNNRSLVAAAFLLLASTISVEAQIPPVPADPSLPRSTRSTPSQPAMNDQIAPAKPNSGMAIKAPVNITEFSGMSVAKVGLEEITLAELRYAVDGYFRDHGPPDSRLGKSEINRITNQLASELLNHKIEQSLIVQHARRTMKDKKKWDQFMKTIDKQFYEEKLPNLLKRHEAADENELRVKLEAKGQSFDEIRKTFRTDVITQFYIWETVGKKIKPQLPELEAYYHAHLHEFDAPAQISFREIVIKFESDARKAEARQQAEAALARLHRGEDFARVARTVSQGATAAKGGLWEKVQPGGFAPEVNIATEQLPLRQLSSIIEGPSAYRILRVEFRRKAGPLTFEEAQDQVSEILAKQLYLQAVEKFLAKLRSTTIITTIFDGTATDPKVRRASARAEDLKQ